MRYRFAAHQFEPAARMLTTANGGSATLTPKAARLLELLLEAAPAPVTRDEAYAQLWPGTFVEPGNLHNLVAEIRNALGSDGRGIVQTVHGSGYVMSATVERESDVRFLLMIGDSEHALREGATIIGREQTLTPDVSRRHARFTVEGDRVLVEDLGSKNGTYVNGLRTTERTAVTEASEILLDRTHVRLAAVAASTVTVTRL